MVVVRQLGEDLAAYEADLAVGGACGLQVVAVPGVMKQPPVLSVLWVEEVLP